MILKLASRKDIKKYDKYFMRSYVEYKNNDSIKWCPAPGCDRALELLEHGGSEINEVECGCLHCFCWNCREESHSPVECKVVAEWITKNSSEAENATWIMAYTKPCPKCRRLIEKNHGCNHMTCPCRHEFCWLCLLPCTSEHNCNRYNDEKSKEKIAEDKIKRKSARRSILRYAHYYERWASNEKSRQQAIDDLHKLQTFQLAKLGNRVAESVSSLEFIVQAWKQIIECRRVLKWTYAYGYFLPKHEDVKRQLFEYLQGEAENGLERLHHCVEIELSKKFLAKYDEDNTKADFIEFRKKLIGLTKVTGTYFENLVKALENSLSEVSQEASTSKGRKRRRVT